MLPISIDIDSSFFEEEKKCGFNITKQRKEMWAVELDMLAQLDRVCKKHGLTYFAGAGTLLGAVRHGGFIPWDDDIDVYMLRPDYDRFVELASEFEHPYFLQTSLTEKNLLHMHAKIRNTLTTGATKKEAKRDINNGLFIDIFPLDGVCPGKLPDYIQRVKNTFYRKCFVAFNNMHDPSVSFKAAGFKGKLKYIQHFVLAKLFARDKEKLFRKYDNNLKKYSVPGTKVWGNRTLVFPCPKSRRPYEDWQDIITLPFEFTEIPAPAAYDSMLRQQYGDYMKIPENKNGTRHGELTVSTGEKEGSESD